MDRLGQLRGEAGGSQDSTVDTTSSPSESFLTANDSSSKYFSTSEVSEIDSSFDISPMKDVSLASASASEPTMTNTDELMNLSPIGKKSDILDSYKIGKQIEAENILSGGVDIFDDNENSYDGDELVIDDNVDMDEKSNDMKMIEDNNISESTLVDDVDVTNKDTEVVLQIDGKNVDAIDIGNGLYLYRKQGQEELAAVQIIDDDQQQPSFKFLKVRENAEGNLEVYEEIEIEVPKEVPTKEGKLPAKNTSHVPVKEISKVISDPDCNKVTEKTDKIPQKEVTTSPIEPDTVVNKDIAEVKSESSFNGKMKKISEARKSPVIGSFTPMTFHSTPNKEGIPLTKTMVDQQLHPSRHSDNVKKTIEVHTDSIKQRIIDPNVKCKDLFEDVKAIEPAVMAKDNIGEVNDMPEQVTESDTIISEKKEDVVDTSEKIENEAGERVDFISGVEGNNKDVEIIPENNGTKNMLSLNKPLENISENIPPICSPKLELDTETTPISVQNQEKTNKEQLSQSMSIPPEEQNAVEVIKSEDIPSSKAVEEVDSGVTPKECDRAGTQKESINQNITEIIPTCNIIEEQVDDNLESNNLIISEVSMDDEISVMDTKADSKLEKQDAELIESGNDVTIDIVPKANNNKDEKNVNIDSPRESTKEDKNSDSEHTETITCTRVEVQAQENMLDAKQKHEDEITKLDKNVIKIDSGSSKQEQQEIKKCEKTGPSVISSDKIDTPTMQPYATAILPDKKDVLLKENVKAKSTSIKEDVKVIPKSEHNKDNKFDDIVVREVVASDIKEPEVKIQENFEQDKKEPVQIVTATEVKPINNNHAPVPFGKWTEANRQDFLNKIKEAKVPVNSSNNKQIKNSNDLNRRDVLKKIDSQRQSNIEIQRAKAQEINKINIKNEIAFTSKTTTSHAANQESKIPVKSEISELKTKPIINKKVTKQEPQPRTVTPAVTPATMKSDTKKESAQRKELNTAQDLIDQTIEGMLHKSLPPTKSAKEISAAISKSKINVLTEHFDEIEMKMNELHGIPFIERPPHELPRVLKTDQKETITEEETPKNKTSKTNLVPLTDKNQQHAPKDALLELDSDDEVIEHVPITGDIDLKVKNVSAIFSSNVQHSLEPKDSKNDISKKEAVITEKDFDKFARRNSFTYENCLTVNFEGKDPHNVKKTVIQKDTKNYSWNVKNTDTDVKIKSPPHKSQTVRLNLPANKNPGIAKYVPSSEETGNKNYQSKVQIAYQSLTAKRQNTCPITIIEDKPVKVIFMDANAEYLPSQLNVQGQELSPAKKSVIETDALTASTGDSLDSDIMESIYDSKTQDELKTKSKHLRKQVLTPVETPELELIEPSDLGIEGSPKKKRRTDESKIEKSPKTVPHKKSYLLGRSSMTEDKANNVIGVVKTTGEGAVNRNEIVARPQNPVSAIDNLVKAAELLETQSENTKNNLSPQADKQQNTPAKRGRGRPRKYPLPEGTIDKTKVPSPQKKAKISESITEKSDTDDEVNSDGEIIKENWTMGKINENIVCPICNKLFRSENVVFKHVKHCTGPSPNRSDSDNMSLRRFRQSQDSDTKSSESKSDEMDIDEENPPTRNENKTTPKKRKSRDTQKSEAEKDDIIVIEDTPIKEKLVKHDDAKHHESRKMTKIKTETSNLVCEFCGKTFRQLSYLASHKLQHKKEEAKKSENETHLKTRSVFSCEVCKKEFRKLHHLVQHRIIHNPNAMPSRLLRKSSSEQRDLKAAKEQDGSKPSEDLSAGFRCEPCDKSFRKLHHLVEHRETHDGINRQKSTSAAQPIVEKPPPPPQCDVCKKTFRKLHHLIEHKEQHVETGSEKSDDKSVKSSLSTKDIIHECSLCYMVFPNEHSLTKHTVICQRKKRQSKQRKPSNTGEQNEEDNSTIQSEENTVEDIDEPELVSEEPIQVDNTEQIDESINIERKDEVKSPEPPQEEKLEDIPLVQEHKELKPPEVDNMSLKEKQLVKDISPKIMEIPDKPSELIKNIEVKRDDKEIVKVPEVIKKKTPTKDKVGPTVTKRRRTSNLPLPSVTDAKPVDHSDDDDVRYMLNPDFKVDDTSEGKLFMRVRAKKRNSLQIERPNSKDLVMRRISLQHPPKIPRLKPKPVEVKPVASISTKNSAKISKLEPVPSTDSDDSDVKYSFPKPPLVKTPKPANEVAKHDLARKSQRKSLAEKRKSLSTIAKRKSLGKALVSRQKANPSPAKPIKRRTTEVEHRCDCGQLFSSAALLSRHTTLAHTPPRIRRRRSPPPDVQSKTLTKPALRKSSTADKTSDSRKSIKQVDSRKSSVRSDTNATAAKPSVSSRKSSVKNEAKTPNDTRKPTKPVDKSDTKLGSSNVKPRRTPAHRGVPVPEKMKNMINLLQKRK